MPSHAGVLSHPHVQVRCHTGGHHRPSGDVVCDVQERIDQGRLTATPPPVRHAVQWYVSLVVVFCCLRTLILNSLRYLLLLVSSPNIWSG